MPKSNPQEKKTPAANSQWLAFLNLSWLFLSYLAVFVGGGLWLDTHFGTSPILILIGVCFAFTGSGYTLYRAVKKLESEEASQGRA